VSFPDRANQHELGFTLVEFLVVIVVIIILVLLLGPALVPRHKDGHRRIRCVSNLKQVILAEQIWIHDNEKSTYHWRTPLVGSGTRNHPLMDQAWFQWAWISNELGIPKILVCPADNKRIADSWSEAEGGFVNSNSQNNSVSYWIGADAGGGMGEPDGPFAKTAAYIISGDRNLSWDGRSDCSLGIRNAWSIRVGPPSGDLRWTNAIHGQAGNLALSDGSVMQLSQIVPRDLTSEDHLGYDPRPTNGPAVHAIVP
jgi:type II secretory pathway pseudopilin PulG